MNWIRGRAPALGLAVRSFKRDESGVAAIYVGVIIFVLLGFLGLSFDAGRLFITHTQAQNAADSAALAAAARLTGGPTAIADATNAALNLTQNPSTLDESGGTIGIDPASIIFLSSLPPDDEPITNGTITTDPAEAQFVYVRTLPLTHRNRILTVLGVGGTTNVVGEAVAGSTTAACEVPPLMICNPFEDPGGGGTFPIASARGVQIRAKAQGSGAAWRPGNFGFLRPPGGESGAKAIWEAIATGVAGQCIENDGVDTQTGEITSLYTAFNVRFDLFQNPHGGGAAKNDPRFRPAINVTKGAVVPDPPGNQCSPEDPVPPTTEAQGFGRDAVFDPVTRLGNGDWDSSGYWSMNHGGAMPGGLPTTPAGDPTRFSIYRHEIDNDMIPGFDAGTTDEEGVPLCYAGPDLTDPGGDLPGGSTARTRLIAENPSVSIGVGDDRRVTYFAVVNCIAEGPINGHEEDVPTIGFVKAFQTEPMPPPPDATLYLEIVDFATLGNDPEGIFKQIVQLYR